MSATEVSSEAAATHPRWQADTALVIVALIWGATFVLIKNAVEHASVLLFLGMRFGIAALALVVIFALRGGLKRVFSKGSIAGGLLAGVCLFGGYFFQTEGLRYTTPGNSGFITGLYIVLVPLLSAAIYRKLPTRSEWIGVALAAAGMAVMMVRRELLAINWGDLLTVGCAILFAFHMIVLSRVSPKMAVERLTLLQLTTCAVLGLAAAPFFETPRILVNSTVISALLITSLFATALAFTVQTWAQRFTSPTRTALIFSLEPVFALVTSYVLKVEEVSTKSLAGAVLILAGILVVELKPAR